MYNKLFIVKLTSVLLMLGVSIPALSWDSVANGGSLSDISYTSSGAADLFVIYQIPAYAGTASYSGIYQDNGDYALDGGWNVARIDQTDGIGHFAMIWQSGAYNYAFATQGGGNGNIARVSQVGDNHFANIIQSGNNNVVSTVQVGSINDLSVSQFPVLSGTNTQYDGNTYTTIANVTQTGDNNYLSAKLNIGSTLNATQQGSGNSLSIVLAPGTYVGINQSR